jgi:seryl-tRNA synthetase
MKPTLSTAYSCIRCELRPYPINPFRRALSTSQRFAQNRRPPTAPKQSPNIKHIRQNVQIYSENCIDRQYKAQASSAEKIASLAQESNEITRRLLTPRARLNELSRQIGKAQAATQPQTDRLESILKEASELAATVKKAEERKTQCDDEAQGLALSMPNLTYPQTPRDEQRVLSYINYQPTQPRDYSNTADHSTIGRVLSLLDFSSASTTSGWGFYYLINEGALLEQALVQYALAVAMRHGWRAASPPSLVYSHIADACGFQPRDQNDEQQIWQIAQLEKDKGKPTRSLAATAEIPLAGINAGKDIPESQFPVKLVGSSRCYRAEAGARGVDTKGLYRVHEFTKVEMFAWTDAPDPSTVDLLSPDWTQHSTAVFDEMVAIQTEILTSLGLPCRVLEMHCTDLGASAYRKIDIEALFPSRMSREGGWGEVTSASICTDYQSRRLDTRIKDKSGRRNRFPHTVNGTATAIPRVLAAILEHGWRETEGVVVVPDVLRPYMAGIEIIGPKLGPTEALRD